MTRRDDTKALIAEARRLDSEATPGPWDARTVSYEEEGDRTIIQRVGITDGAHPEDFLFDVRSLWSPEDEPVQPLADARYIARSRTLLVQLADALERSEKAREELREALLGMMRGFEEPDLSWEDYLGWSTSHTLGDFRRARAALEKTDRE